MTDTSAIAGIVDDAAQRTPGVAQTYIAAPAIQHALASLTTQAVHAHVTTFPRQRIVCSIGIATTADSRATAAAVVDAIRADLPDDWRDAELTVQIRRIHD